FVGAGLRMQVALEPSWLEAVWQMYVGVKSNLPPDVCARLLTTAGSSSLDMKIGSSARVDEIFTKGMAGLRFTHTPNPPQVLPSPAGLIYFQVDRQSQQNEWQNVQKELSL